jgi:hypothetical protein
MISDSSAEPTPLDLRVLIPCCRYRMHMHCQRIGFGCLSLIYVVQRDLARWDARTTQRELPTFRHPPIVRLLLAMEATMFTGWI